MRKDASALARIQRESSATDVIPHVQSASNIDATNAGNTHVTTRVNRPQIGYNIRQV